MMMMMMMLMLNGYTVITHRIHVWYGIYIPFMDPVGNDSIAIAITIFRDISMTHWTFTSPQALENSAVHEILLG